MSIQSTVKQAADTVRTRAGPRVNNLIDPSKSGVHRAANAGTIISVVVIGVVAIVGILIYAQINNALPAPENTGLSESQVAVTDGFGGAMELVPVVLLVLVAALVIGVVQRMRQ